MSAMGRKRPSEKGGKRTLADPSLCQLPAADVESTSPQSTSPRPDRAERSLAAIVLRVHQVPEGSAGHLEDGAEILEHALRLLLDIPLPTTLRSLSAAVWPAMNSRLPPSVCMPWLYRGRGSFSDSGWITFRVIDRVLSLVDCNKDKCR